MWDKDKKLIRKFELFSKIPEIQNSKLSNGLEAPESGEGLNLVDQVNLSASIEQVNLDSWPDSDENLPWATRNPAGSASSSIFFIHLFLPYSTILVFPIQPSFPSLFNHPFLPFSSILAFPFTYPFLPIFIHPFVLFSSIVSFPFNLSFPPYSSILSVPFHPSFPFLAFTIHPSFPSFFISSIIFYLFYLFLNLFISISSFLNFFIPLLIFFLSFFFSLFICRKSTSG